MELPRLEPLYSKYQDQGLQIIAVDTSRDRERAEKFIAENKLSYSCLQNGEGGNDFVHDVFQVTAHPTSFLIDGSGKVLYMHRGYDEGDDLKMAKEIERILEL